MKGIRAITPAGNPRKYTNQHISPLFWESTFPSTSQHRDIQSSDGGSGCEVYCRLIRQPLVSGEVSMVEALLESASILITSV
jgi:hypothetical protein